jgi:hypothetical protein
MSWCIMLSITGVRVPAHICIGPSVVMPNITMHGTPVISVSPRRIGIDSSHVGKKLMLPPENNIVKAHRAVPLPQPRNEHKENFLEHFTPIEESY